MVHLRHQNRTSTPGTASRVILILDGCFLHVLRNIGGGILLLCQLCLGGRFAIDGLVVSSRLLGRVVGPSGFGRSRWRRVRLLSRFRLKSVNFGLGLRDILGKMSAPGGTHKWLLHKTYLLGLLVLVLLPVIKFGLQLINHSRDV